MVKVNIDEEQALARQEQIEVIPTLVLYQKDKERNPLWRLSQKR